MKQVKFQCRAFQILFICLGIVIVLISGTINTLQAQEPKLPSASEVKYIGMSDGKLVFQINYQSDSYKTFNLEIKDRQGYSFYNEVIKAKKFTQQFAIEKYDMQNNSITFFISSKNNVNKYSFDISTSLRVEANSIAKQ